MRSKGKRDPVVSFGDKVGVTQRQVAYNIRVQGNAAHRGIVLSIVEEPALRCDCDMSSRNLCSNVMFESTVPHERPSQGSFLLVLTYEPSLEANTFHEIPSQYHVSPALGSLSAID